MFGGNLGAVPSCFHQKFIPPTNLILNEAGYLYSLWPINVVRLTLPIWTTDWNPTATQSLQRKVRVNLSVMHVWKVQRESEREWALVLAQEEGLTSFMAQVWYALMGFEITCRDKTNRRLINQHQQWMTNSRWCTMADCLIRKASQVLQEEKRKWHTLHLQEWEWNHVNNYRKNFLGSDTYHAWLRASHALWQGFEKTKKKCVSDKAAEKKVFMKRKALFCLHAFIQQNENCDVPLQVQCYGAGLLGRQTGHRTNRLFRC